MDLAFSAEDLAFQQEVRDWIAANLTDDLREAAAKGVEVLVVGCALSPTEILVDRPMRWRWAP